MSVLVLLFSLLTFALILVGSLVPGRLRPRSGLDGHIEHALAYGCGGIALLPLGTESHHILASSIALIGLAGLLELGQVWVPGRSCRLTHFLASAAGVGLWLVMAFATKLLIAPLLP